MTLCPPSDQTPVAVTGGGGLSFGYRHDEGMALSHARQYGFHELVEGQEVHLRHKGAPVTDKPEYSKAKVVSHPSGTKGEMHIDSRVDGVPYPIELSEKVYDAWSLHS